jgi:hypothetical protein
MTQVDSLVNHIRNTLGDLDAPLSDDETYWYSTLGLCVTDAVYSIGVRYESTRRTVSDFCKWAHWEEDLAKAPREYTISEFVALLEPYARKWEEMADEVFHNRQRTRFLRGVDFVRGIEQERQGHDFFRGNTNQVVPHPADDRIDVVEPDLVLGIMEGVGRRARERLDDGGVLWPWITWGHTPLGPKETEERP